MGAVPLFESTTGATIMQGTISAIITDHAFQRGKERLGLNKKALQRTADKALGNGTTRDLFTGGFRRYLDKLFHSHDKLPTLIIFGHHIYVFCGVTLVTVLEVPREYVKTATKGKRS